VVAAVTNLNVQALFDLPQVAVELTAEASKAAIVIRLQRQLLGNGVGAGYCVIIQRKLGLLWLEVTLSVNHSCDREKSIIRLFGS
jgi:hypothetical protein